MRFLASLLILLSAVTSSRCAEFSWSAPNLPADDEMSLRLWVPDGVKSAKEVLVLVPGRNGDGRPMASDAEWRALARRWQCPLLACKLTGDSYHMAGTWSGGDLLNGLRELGQASQLPELDKAALFFFGHSNGGLFSTTFLDWRADQVAGVVAVNGNIDPMNSRETKFQVPVLFLLGEKDSDEVRERMVNAFSEGRRQGAPWAFAIQPGAGHELGGSKALAVAFFDAVLRQRRASGDKPAPWVGDFRTHEIKPALAPKPDSKLNAWLPDERFARKWRNFVTGGK